MKVFDEVESDPSKKTLLKALNIAKNFKPTGILGFGGGSSMDIAKLVSLLIGAEQNIEKENLQYSIMKFSASNKRWDKIGNLDFSFSNKRNYIYDYHQSLLKRSFNFFDENYLYLLIFNELYTFDFKNQIMIIDKISRKDINTVDSLDKLLGYFF